MPPHISDYRVRMSPDSEPPTVSVVTAVRNGEKTIARTIDSVRAQNICNLEYIIVDACSTDATQDIIRANADVVSYWGSEPDRGISDGFNKGIALTQGKYVALVNADDWLSPGQLAAGIETLEQTGADFVFGDLLYHDEDGKALHRIVGDADYARRIGHVMPALNHPTVIVRRSAYERHGLFCLSYRYAMDYELLLRFHRAGARGIHDPRMIGHMTIAGASDKSSLKALREVRIASIAHGKSAATAFALYYFRIAKDRARRLVERFLPHTLSVALRGAVNRDLVKTK